jgi:hypothetical protein
MVALYKTSSASAGSGHWMAASYRRGVNPGLKDQEAPMRSRNSRRSRRFCVWGLPNGYNG